MAAGMRLRRTRLPRCARNGRSRRAARARPPARRRSASARAACVLPRITRNSAVAFARRAYSTSVKVVFAGAVGLVAYTFAGYPALVAALARVRPRPVLADPSIEPSVSLIVVAHNEEDVIGERLRNCLALDYPRERVELMVVADGSDDGTAD